MQIDHTAYPKSLRSKNVGALEFIRADARAALQAMPDGHKAGYYADEINYVSDELARRRRAAEKVARA